MECMRFAVRSLVRDQRGAALPEYALLLVAVLLSAAGAVKRIGPRVFEAANVTERILAGEDVNVRASLVGVTGGVSFGGAGSSSSGASGSSSGASSRPSIGSSGPSGGVTLGGSNADAYSGASRSGAGGLGSPSGFGSRSAAGSSAGSSAGSAAGNGGFLGGTGAESYSGEELASRRSGSSAGSNDASYPQGFLGGTGAPARPGNSVNPPPGGNPGGSEGATSGDGYTISAAGEAEMKTLLAQAKKNADGKRPKGWCYKQVKEDIAEVGYGNIAKQGDTSQLKPLPGSDQEYAHDFADYMNAKGANGQTNASNLGLQKLPITNPYDAPPGSIVVVRAGTPGTRNPVAGDIVVAGGNGKFYNDGNMGYGGSKNFPKGNTYVLGIYAPK